MREVTDALERFRLQDAALRGYDFFWGELADWYLELVKPRLRGDMGDGSRAPRRPRWPQVLDGAMRLLHPIMPFITEAVWQKLPRAADAGASLIVARWPEPRPEWEDEAAERAIAELQEVIGAVRTIRGGYGVQPAARVPLRVTGETRCAPLLEAAAAPCATWRGWTIWASARQRRGGRQRGAALGDGAVHPPRGRDRPGPRARPPARGDRPHRRADRRRGKKLANESSWPARRRTW